MVIILTISVVFQLASINCGPEVDFYNAEAILPERLYIDNNYIVTGSIVSTDTVAYLCKTEEYSNVNDWYLVSYTVAATESFGRIAADSFVFLITVETYNHRTDYRSAYPLYENRMALVFGNEINSTDSLILSLQKFMNDDPLDLFLVLTDSAFHSEVSYSESDRQIAANIISNKDRLWTLIESHASVYPIIASTQRPLTRTAQSFAYGTLFCPDSTDYDVVVFSRTEYVKELRQFKEPTQ